jgi:hypothetical protein
VWGTGREVRGGGRADETEGVRKRKETQGGGNGDGEIMGGKGWRCGLGFGVGMWGKVRQMEIGGRRWKSKACNTVYVSVCVCVLVRSCVRACIFGFSLLPAPGRG